jgi:2-octaprenyl-6-methoxyphenol hydroxylase
VAERTGESRRHTDVLIVGAGPVGMTLALALATAEPALRVCLLDRRHRGSHAGDPRALALSHGTRQLLERLGAWNAAAGTPIVDIHVSQSGGFGRTLITREEQQVDALGYVMRYGDLAAALAGTLAARIGADSVLDGCEVLGIGEDGDARVVRIRRGGNEEGIRTRLVVHAEGSPGDDAGVRVADYRQHAVLAEVRTATPPAGRAWERFTADGPLALLPLDDGYSVVFTVPPAKADALMVMNDDDFLTALQHQFGSRLAFTATSPRARFPLALRWRQRLASAREVWIGNAAQTLHPVSGQGFNLGIRDAWELAETLLDTGNITGDPGHPAALAAYSRRRLLDRAGGAAFTDGIVRAFSNDFAPLRLARGLGLMALDLCPPARQFVADRMIWGARGLL